MGELLEGSQTLFGTLPGRIMKFAKMITLFGFGEPGIVIFNKMLVCSFVHTDKEKIFKCKLLRLRSSNVANGSTHRLCCAQAVCNG